MKKGFFLLLLTFGFLTTQAQNDLKTKTVADTSRDSLAVVTPPLQLVNREPESAAQMAAEQAQRDHDNNYESEVFRTGAAIFAMVVIMVFIVIMVRTYMDNRLRHKILESNVQPDSLNALLDLTPQDRKVSNLRWVFILAGVGFGLHLGGMVRIGIHSVAIMCLCLAASFLAFHFFVLRKR